MARRPIRSTPDKWEPRRTVLLVLPDQGEGKPVPIDVFPRQGRDQRWDWRAEAFINANRPSLDALALEPRLEPSRAEVSLKLYPQGIIGAAPLRSPDTRKVVGGVVVRPRFGWGGIGPVLSAVGWSASPEILEQPLVPGSAREVPPWVLAGPVISRIASLLKHLVRGFNVIEEVRTTPRGQILWNRYLQREVMRGYYHRLPCRFPELGADTLLRSYLRWTLERVKGSLSKFAVPDLTAHHLVALCEALLYELGDIPAVIPNRRAIDAMLRGTGLPSSILKRGLEAVAWILDERGLGETAPTDGLSWRLPMHELFERWVEAVVRHWAEGFGGQVLTAHSGSARFPIFWRRSGAQSLTSLAPDIVVTAEDTVYIFDAKYKRHLEELDDTQWRELNEQLRAEHRNDFHQALAYASLFDMKRIVTSLVYPLRLGTWRELLERAGCLSRARIPHGRGQLEVALVGIPIEAGETESVRGVSRILSPLATELR